MNLLDWLLVLLALVYGLSGYWQGFITGIFATLGLLAGGAFGVWLAPIALGDANPSLLVSLGALFIVILSASLGQAALQYVGARVRSRIKWQPVRSIDAFGGAILSSVAVLLVAWALGVAISGSRISGVTPMVRSSAVLAKVNTLLPGDSANLLQSFNDVVGTGFFPRYLEPFSPERIVEVAPGDKRMLRRPAIQSASQSIVKVRGTNRCGRGVEGSGFIFAPDRIMTNAHVVAGVTDPDILVGNDTLHGRVVYYNPQVDLAVIAADTGSRNSLVFDFNAKPQDAVAIIGYPQDGPYDVRAGRIRAEQRLRSPDIYGNGTVIREVFSLRGLVRPGNSGGPILTTDGEVAGVVFAASVTDADTGYALTSDQAVQAANTGRSADATAGTGNCAS